MKAKLRTYLGTALMLTMLAACASALPIASETAAGSSITTQAETAMQTVTPTITESPTSTPHPTSTPQLNDQGYLTYQDERGVLFVTVPPGTFTMGLNDNEYRSLCNLWSSDLSKCAEIIDFSYQSHEVTISTSFGIDVYEVTNAEYQMCVQQGLCAKPVFTDSRKHASYYLSFPNYPFNAASWDDANVYCQQWRSGRLPTEAEWEYAARGSDGRLWPWGDSLPTIDFLNYLPYEYRLEYGNDAVEVGNFPNGVSPFGVFDMAGNVEEWVADWYSNYPQGPVTDPQGPEGGVKRVIRGGSYGGGPIEVSSIYRYQDKPDQHDLYGRGFRCVKELP